MKLPESFFDDMSETMPSRILNRVGYAESAHKDEVLKGARIAVAILREELAQHGLVDTRPPLVKIKLGLSAAGTVVGGAANAEFVRLNLGRVFEARRHGMNHYSIEDIGQFGIHAGAGTLVHVYNATEVS